MLSKKFLLWFCAVYHAGIWSSAFAMFAQHGGPSCRKFFGKTLITDFSSCWHLLSGHLAWTDILCVDEVFFFLFGQKGCLFLLICQDFLRDPSIQEWREFMEKTKYVWVFRDPTFGGGSTRLTNSAIGAIARSRPMKTIFPSLEVFHMTSLGTRRLFMAESAKEFIWRIEVAMVGAEMQRVCEEIVFAMPGIEVLKIQVDSLIGVETSLCWMCENLPNLGRVVLPLYGLSASLFQVLAPLSGLEDIDFERTVREQAITGHSSSMDAVNHFSLDKHSFPHPSFASLTRFSIALPGFPQLLEILQCPAVTLCILQRLTVRIPSRAEDIVEEVNGLIRWLAVGCSSLGELSLYFSPQDRDVLTAIAHSRRVRLSDLESLSGLSSLRSFAIHLARPIDMDDADMEKLAISLPNIISLSLNPHPSLAEEPSTTFAVLSSFARYCSQLRDLGLYLNGRVGFTWCSKPTFSSDFHVLRLGRSYLPDSEDVDCSHQIAGCIGDLVPASAIIHSLYIGDVMDSVGFAATISEIDNPHIWQQFQMDFRASWADIAMLVKAVAHERAAVCSERVHMEEILQGIANEDR